MLSELASPETRNKTTPTAINPHNTTSDELISAPVLVPRLQATPSLPSTSTTPQFVHFAKGPNRKNQSLKNVSRGETNKPISLKMFNEAATDLNSKGVINLKSIEGI